MKRRKRVKTPETPERVKTPETPETPETPAWAKLLRGPSDACMAAWAPLEKDDMLMEFIKRCLRSLTRDERDMLATTVDHNDGIIRVGSACSGSEVARPVCARLASALRCKCPAVFACEKEHWKRDWVRKVVEPTLGEEACCFGFIESLSGRRSKCYLHVGRECEIPSCFIFSSGFSCKSLSKVYANRQKMKSCMEEEIGSTGKTFKGLCEYLRSHRPEVIILENVQEVTEGDNYKALVENLDNLHYQAATTILKSSSYVSAQRRERAFVIAFACGDQSAEDSKARPSKCLRLVKRFVVPSPVLTEEFVMSPDSSYLRKELDRRLLLREQARPSGTEEASERKEPNKGGNHLRQ